MSAEGALRFARYAYPPNALGYCGPAGAHALLDGTVDEIGRRARQFEGAWAYLEFLADVLGGRDPLADDVVEAYWVGADVVETLDPKALVNRLEAGFPGQVGGTWRSATARARAHHSFQVFEVYPWAGMLRQGRTPGPAVNVLDRCRIRTATVTAVDGEHVDVTSVSLQWHEPHLIPMAPAPGRAQWSVNGASLIAAPQIGDVVALHWDWVCEVLTPAQAATIERFEHEQRVAIGLSG